MTCTLPAAPYVIPYQRPINVWKLFCFQPPAGYAAISAGIGGLVPSASATVYNRTAAVNYANTNWNKVVSDGYFWINGSTANYYGAGAAVPVNVAGEAGGIGDDCAHYVSSCIGSPV